ncbi:hypothetical protein OH799_06695 [Nocardia sp. NBC_00881]|uniref:hypothetical protein n=1 Tax=Nocardia sp. NBC_00881 TaxID=2975995 RepID=UPI00386C94B4|nr:hypothetical protein OH799_06695 [Nocardia sp. NBC_00881]
MSASPADVAAVAMLAERFGVTAAGLAAATSRAPVPTFAEYIPHVFDSMPQGCTRDHYMTYWRKILAQQGWADRRLDEPRASRGERWRADCDPHSMSGVAGWPLHPRPENESYP